MCKLLANLIGIALFSAMASLAVIFAIVASYLIHWSFS